MQELDISESLSGTVTMNDTQNEVSFVIYYSVQFHLFYCDCEIIVMFIDYYLAY